MCHSESVSDANCVTSWCQRSIRQVRSRTRGIRRAPKSASRGDVTAASGNSRKREVRSAGGARRKRLRAGPLRARPAFLAYLRGKIIGSILLSNGPSFALRRSSRIAVGPSLARLAPSLISCGHGSLILRPQRLPLPLFRLLEGLKTRHGRNTPPTLASSFARSHRLQSSGYPRASNVRKAFWQVSSTRWRLPERKARVSAPLRARYS